MPHETLTAELPAAPPVEAQLVNVETLPVEMVQQLGGEAVEAYFHGTNFPFRLGEDVLPIGAQATNDENGVLHASATTWEAAAWDHAEMRASEYGGRARVFRVVPSHGSPLVKTGPQFAEVNSPKFTVVEQVDTKPGHQGTFPEVNWSKYSPYIGANHPENPLWTPDMHEVIREKPSPNDIPIPELGAEYVKTELENARKASGAPFI